MNAAVFIRVEPFLAGLKLYCLKLAKNEWDAQDLMQESLAKIYRALQQMPDREFNKAYLNRIVTNAWKDYCRRKQASGADIAFDEEQHQPKAVNLNEMAVREAFEQLANRLNVRQMVLILLIDIFKFTASETAELLHTSVGAIKEGLKRARQRLLAMAAQSAEAEAEGIHSLKRGSQHKAEKQLPVKSLSKEVFEQFLAGFRAGDAAAICRTYLLLVNNGVYIEKVSAAGGQIQFTFRDPNGHLISFFQES